MPQSAVFTSHRQISILKVCCYLQTWNLMKNIVMEECIGHAVNMWIWICQSKNVADSDKISPGQPQPWEIRAAVEVLEAKFHNWGRNHWVQGKHDTVGTSKEIFEANFKLTQGKLPQITVELWPPQIISSNPMLQFDDSWICGTAFDCLHWLQFMYNYTSILLQWMNSKYYKWIIY